MNTSRKTTVLWCALVVFIGCSSEPAQSPQDVEDAASTQDGSGKDASTKVARVEWTLGGPYREEARAVLEAEDGDFIIAGYTESWGAGDWDGLVVRASPCGEMRWAKAYGGVKKDALYGVAGLPGGSLGVAGVTHSFEKFVEAWVMRLDSAGEVQWSAAYGGGGHDLALAVTATLDGDLVVLGETYNFGPGTPENHNLALMRVRGSDGALLWDRVYGGGDAGDAGFALIRIGGSSQKFLITGATESFGYGRDDVWLLQVTPDGALDWSRSIGDVEDDESRTISPDGKGGYLVTGFTRSWTQGKSDGFILRVDAEGEVSWLRAYGSAERERLYGAHPTAGGLVALGHTQTFGDGEVDGWALELDAQGEVVRSWLLGGDLDDEVVTTFVSATGQLWFAGWSSSAGAGGRDMWVGREPQGQAEVCSAHQLSEGKVKIDDALPTAQSVSPTVVSGFERQDAPVSRQSVPLKSAVHACEADACAK